MYLNLSSTRMHLRFRSFHLFTLSVPIEHKPAVTTSCESYFFVLPAVQEARRGISRKAAARSKEADLKFVQFKYEDLQT